MKSGSKWTNGEIEFVTANATSMSDREIAKRLNRTEHGVAHTRKRLGIAKPGGKVVGTPEQCALLAERWHWASRAQIARELGISDDSVSALAGRMGLGRNTYGQKKAKPCPMKQYAGGWPAPTGPTPAAVAWANANRNDPEARLILGMAQEWKCMERAA